MTGPHSVTVATGEGPVELAGENILVATGSKPSRPPIPGLDLPHVGTSDEFLFLEDKLYENLIDLPPDDRFFPLGAANLSLKILYPYG